MDLREYLDTISYESLKVIGEELSIRQEIQNRRNLVAEIDRRLFDQSYLTRLIARLDNIEKKVLTALTSAGSPGHSSNSLAIRFHKSLGLQPEDLMAAIRSLMMKGIIIARGFEDLKYFVADDIRQPIETIIFQWVAGELETFSPEGAVTKDYGLSIVRDIFSFLSYIAKQKVPLTQKGIIHKRTLKDILSYMEVKEELPATFSSLSWDECPARLRIIIRYCFQKKLVENADDTLSQTDLVINWLQMSDYEKLDDLMGVWYSAVHSRYVPLETILKILGFLKPGYLVKIGPLGDAAYLYSSYPYQTESTSSYETALLRNIFEDLNWLGVVSLVLDSAGSIAGVALTQLGASLLRGGILLPEIPISEEIFAQPNFEILVPKEFDLKLRARLEEFADLVSVDQFLVYRISRESIYRASEYHISADSIIAFLKKHSKVQVSQNIEYTITEWGESYGKIFFTDALLMRTASDELADELKSVRTIQPFIKGEVSSKALVVDRKRYMQLLRELRKAGYLPRTMIGGLQEPRKLVKELRFERTNFHDVLRSTNLNLTPSLAVNPIVDLGFWLDSSPASPRIGVHQEERSGSITLESHGDIGVLDILREAIDQGKNVLIDYLADNERLIKRIKPISILRQFGGTYVEASCFPKGENQNFKISRIKRAKILVD